MDAGSALTWQVRVCQPGTFEVSVTAAPVHGTEEVSEHQVAVEVGGESVAGPLREAILIDTPRAQYFPEYRVVLGRLTIAAAGIHVCNLRATEVVPGTPDGVTVFGATLQPVSA